jgi:hypothetical protein
MTWEREEWHRAQKGRVADVVFEQVSQMEQDQSDAMERMARLYWLYDPEAENAEGSTGKSKAQQVVQNLIASNVDTVCAIVTATDIRPRVLTDDADWSLQRKMEHCSWYGEAFGKKLELHSKCAEAFRLGGAIKGIGLVQVDNDRRGQTFAEMVHPDDIIVSRDEAHYGPVLQMHRCKVVDARKLAAEYPEFKEEIMHARGGGKMQRHWADYRPVGKQQVPVLESWVLPVGVKGQEGYEPGRHTVVIPGQDLLDEEWEWGFFPFAEFRWAVRARQWHGISLAERIAGMQRVLTKYHWQMDLLIDKWAVPTTYVQPADAGITIKSTNRAGTFLVTKSGTPPATVIPPAVSADMYKRAADIEAMASRETGVSTMAAHGTKPAGIEAGVALREYRDATTQKFALQEKAFERFLLEAHWLALWCAKRLGDKAPEVVRRSVHGPRKIKWSDVDVTELKVQLVAASTLGRSPAGRAAFVMEMASGGVISQDVARKLLMPHSPLDVDREMSLYAAAMDSADADIEHILDGGEAWPTAYQNARMNVWRGQATLLRISQGEDEGYSAPEEIIERLRQWVVQSAWIVSQSEKTPAMPPDALGLAAPAPVPGVMPAAPAMGVPPVADPGPAMTGAGVAPVNLIA